MKKELKAMKKEREIIKKVKNNKKSKNYNIVFILIGVNILLVGILISTFVFDDKKMID